MLHVSLCLMFCLAACACAWLPPMRPARSRTLAPRMVLNDLAPAEFDELGSVDQSPVGVLLLSVGAPSTTDDVEEYLYNVFCDPEILTLPPAFSWALKRPVAWAIAKSRAEGARQAMMQTSPNTTQTIEAQASALTEALSERGVRSKVYIAMRYWHPFAEEAVAEMNADGIERLVILPLYPQFSISTSGSALRVLERMLYTEPGFPMKSSVVPAWYNRPGYLQVSPMPRLARRGCRARRAPRGGVGWLPPAPAPQGVACPPAAEYREKDR